MLWKSVKFTEHRVYQHTSFSSNSADPIQVRQSQTNTCDLASASYIAHRAMVQLRLDVGDNLETYSCIFRGADDVSTARIVIREVK